jgi:hypothetical protein
MRVQGHVYVRVCGWSRKGKGKKTKKDKKTKVSRCEFRAELACPCTANAGRVLLVGSTKLSSPTDTDRHDRQNMRENVGGDSAAMKAPACRKASCKRGRGGEGWRWRDREAAWSWCKIRPATRGTDGLADHTERVLLSSVDQPTAMKGKYTKRHLSREI